MTPQERERAENPAAMKAMDMLTAAHGEVYADLCGIVARLSTISVTAEESGAPEGLVACLKQEICTLQLTMRTLFKGKHTVDQMANDTQTIVRAMFLDVEDEV
jgi:hypothetical protein